MTRLTIELDDRAARRAAERARRHNLTLAEWITRCVAGRGPARPAGERDPLGYPVRWFDDTQGSLADLEDFAPPADPPPEPAAPLKW